MKIKYVWNFSLIFLNIVFISSCTTTSRPGVRNAKDETPSLSYVEKGDVDQIARHIEIDNADSRRAFARAEKGESGIISRNGTTLRHEDQP